MELQLARTSAQSICAPVTRHPSNLIHCDQANSARVQLESFIATEYRKHFGAIVREFMPVLAGLYGDKAELRAAAGYRSAGSEPLFLETYTKAPIEQVVRRHVGIEVPREEIVEVGSLACNGGRAAMDIVTALVPSLLERGFTWVVFTGADSVRNVFRRLHMRPTSLCIANKSLLGDRQSNWGSYYDHNPVVMAGRLADGVVAIDKAGGVQ